jgi:hypothetical protein
MEAVYRIVDTMDWATILLFSCAMSLACVRYFSSASILDFLSVFTSNRFVNITRDDRMDGSRSLQMVGLAIYPITIAMLILQWLTATQSGTMDVTDYLIILTAVSAYLLVKHYLSRLVATIGEFDSLIQFIDHRRNIYRVAFAIVLLSVNVLLLYALPSNQTAIIVSLFIVAFILTIYHLIIVYDHRQALFGSLFYFILYLCTLEIGPYLLLYKYFTA